jgi:hypothetical protein
MQKLNHEPKKVHENGRLFNACFYNSIWCFLFPLRQLTPCWQGWRIANNLGITDFLIPKNLIC